ncbi:SDR family oxidoreductase [Aspergillus undulatus]|uniref:SDR family oxidoreductase n=1 Tax=Aspergillus undulatus TaxID=1810928 RepID=UPI003CCDDDDB
MPRVWHISGANTGFGLELALKALAEGDRVIAAVRTPSRVPDSLRNDGVRIIQFDLTWTQEQMNEYSQKAITAFGKIDVLVNNAGYSYMGAIEESEDTAVKAQFDTNVFAQLRLIRAFLPALRDQGSGTILNFSSIGGLRSYPSNGIYCATKFALEGITEALAAEIAPFGLKAAIIEPGYFRTSFLSSVISGANIAPHLSVYEGTVAHEARKAFEKFDGNQRGDPKEGVKRIWEYVADEGLLKGREKLLRLPLGSDTGFTMRDLAREMNETADVYEEVWRSTDIQEV